MIRTIAVAAACLTALSGAAAGPQPSDRADAGHAGVGLHRRTSLELSYQAEAGYAAAVKLRCEPARSPHPAAADACRTLSRVHGRPDLIEPGRIMCILIYAPITAGITGTWHGRRIAWQHTYGNKCEMLRATGALFTF